MIDFFRFPQTPHIAWLGKGQPRGDKILTSAEANDLLTATLVVEEKIDGANLGFSVSDNCNLLVQNRGGYLSQDSCHKQFRSLWPWLAPKESDLVDALWPDLMLFGEWCVATHSVEYDQLPDWFLGFDVYDRAAARFWDTERRDALLASLELCAVPRVAMGQFTIAELVSLLGSSQAGSPLAEGIVVRREAEGWTKARAKLVRATFTQNIEKHWSRDTMRRNALALSALAAEGATTAARLPPPGK